MVRKNHRAPSAREIFLSRPPCEAISVYEKGGGSSQREGGGESGWRGGRLPLSRQLFSASSRAALDAAV